MQVLTPQDNIYDIIRQQNVLKKPKGNPAGRKKTYLDLVTAFDIETSVIEHRGHPHSIMYLWSYALGPDIVILGRTWKEFISVLEQIRQALPEGVCLVSFVHNLSYEFQFLKGIFEFENRHVFAIDSRKVLKCDIPDYNIELRCSYLHSNMSLKNFTEKMGVEHGKLDGEVFDYSIIRFPWTELSEYEMQYVINDVVGLVEALEKEMQLDHDTLYTLPLTSTGYVRRDVKKAMRDISPGFVKQQLPNVYLYTALREAFRGGNTHANRFYSDMILPNVKSADRVSSYPEVMINRKFPMSEFVEMGDMDTDEYVELMRKGKALLCRVAFSDIKLSNPYWGCPYLARDKCRHIRGAVYDNGRIISAEYLETTITDVDFKIIMDEYSFNDCATFDVWKARYGRLPKPIRDNILKYFYDKTALKGDEENKLYYDKAKALLNAIYGMMVQNPVRDIIELIDNLFISSPPNVEAALEKHNKSAFLCYQWGVWVTAWARHELEEGLKLIGDTYVYGDTDCGKYLGEVDWGSYNDAKKKMCEDNGAYVDHGGKRHYLGLFEEEGEAYRFVTLGAKKYCSEDADGEIKITVAGVPKKKGAKELERKGGIERFKDGFVFEETGKTEAVYNDDKSYGVFRDGEGHEIEVTSNVVLRPTTYQLGVTEYHKTLLEMSREFRKGALNWDNLIDSLI